MTLQQGGDVPFDSKGTTVDNNSPNVLRHSVTADSLRKGLGLIGADGAIGVLQDENVKVYLYDPGDVVAQTPDGKTVIVKDQAIAWTRYGGENRTAIYINQNASTESAMIGFMHEFTHLIGGTEYEAWATTVDVAMKLQPFGGVQATLGPLPSMISNGRINYQGIDSFLNTQMATPGNLYNLTNRQIAPISITQIY